MLAFLLSRNLRSFERAKSSRRSRRLSFPRSFYFFAKQTADEKRFDGPEKSTSTSKRLSNLLFILRRKEDANSDKLSVSKLACFTNQTSAKTKKKQCYLFVIYLSFHLTREKSRWFHVSRNTKSLIESSEIFSTTRDDLSRFQYPALLHSSSLGRPRGNDCLTNAFATKAPSPTSFYQSSRRRKRKKKTKSQEKKKEVNGRRLHI